jgi:hypothetical protein
MVPWHDWLCVDAWQDPRAVHNHAYVAPLLDLSKLPNVGFVISAWSNLGLTQFGFSGCQTFHAPRPVGHSLDYNLQFVAGSRRQYPCIQVHISRGVSKSSMGFGGTPAVISCAENMARNHGRRSVRLDSSVYFYIEYSMGQDSDQTARCGTTWTSLPCDLVLIPLAWVNSSLYAAFHRGLATVHIIAGHTPYCPRRYLHGSVSM